MSEHYTGIIEIHHRTHEGNTRSPAAEVERIVVRGDTVFEVAAKLRRRLELVISENQPARKYNSIELQTTPVKDNPQA